MSTKSTPAYTKLDERHQPTCWIIAGPNGAGKTTFALDYLPEVAAPMWYQHLQKESES